MHKREDFASRMVSKKEAALRQIDGAIKSLFEGEFECAMTLACAAEGQFVSEGDHLFAYLKKGRPEKFANDRQWTTILNETRDWLKHVSGDDEREINEYEAWIMICRAYTKYYDVFREESEEMLRFVEWSRVRGLTAKA
jgi:hypothetical protein